MQPHSWSRLAFSLAFALVAILPNAHIPTHAQNNDRERTLYVSAVDDKGAPIERLTAEAFAIREDGVRREVLGVTPATEPIDIVLMIDNSAAASGQITHLRAALATFVSTMAPRHNIAVITLAQRPTLAQDFTTDPAKLADATGRLFALSNSGMTLFDAIIETADRVAKRPTARVVFIAIVTDGPEQTNYYATDVAQALQRSQIALHAITIGRFDRSDDFERQSLFDKITRLGGQRISLVAPTGLDTALQRVARELTAQYKVIYSRPGALVPPDKLEISSPRPDVTMRGTPMHRPGRT